MRPILVVVADVLIHQAFQMAIIDNDRMVEPERVNKFETGGFRV